MPNEMLRESPYPMVPIDAALQVICGYAAPLGDEEVDILAGAEGRVLAEDVLAPDDLPDVAKSAVDGYALCAVDGLAERRVLAELTAGSPGDIVVGSGEAVRIMTGAPLPPGADAVIMVEQTEERDGVLRVRQAPGRGDNIHTPGQDLARGQLVVPRGTTLTPAEVGLLATIGRTRARVFRRPRVAVLATGDEVFEPGAPPIPGGVRDSNRYALMAAVREAGAEPLSLGIVRDDVALLRAAIEEGLSAADVLLTSGGVSMGTRDLVKPLLAQLGTIHFGRIAFKPGKPTTFATIERPSGGLRLAFGLPGFPVSSLVSFEVFVRPALRRMQGDAQPDRPRARVVLADPITPSADRPEYQRAVASLVGGRLTVRTTGVQRSSRLLSLRGANALLLVPAGARRYEAGEELEALITGPLLG